MALLLAQFATETQVENRDVRCVSGLFDLRIRQPVAVYWDPTTTQSHLADTPLADVFLYAFGVEPHRRLLVRGPGALLREFGVDPASDAFWANYVGQTGPMSLIDPGRSAGFVGEKWAMPWSERQAGDFSALPAVVTDERDEQAG